MLLSNPGPPFSIFPQQAHLALARRTIFIAAVFNLVAIDRCGGKVALIDGSEDPKAATKGAIGSLAADDAGVVWSRSATGGQTTIFSRRLDDTDIVEIATIPGQVQDLGLDSGAIYALSQTAVTSVYRLPRVGGSSYDELAPAVGSISGIAIGDCCVFFTAINGTVGYWEKVSGTLKVLDSGIEWGASGLPRLDAAGSVVVFGPAGGTVRARDVSGDNDVVLGPAAGILRALVLSRRTVFWSDGEGVFVRDVDALSPGVLVAPLVLAPYARDHLVVGGEAVYGMDQDFALRWVARPPPP